MNQIETDLLIELSQPALSSADASRLREIFQTRGPRLDWGFLLDRGARHGVLPIFAKHVEGLCPDFKFVPHLRLLQMARWANRRRNEMFFRELEMVLPELAEAGVKAAIRKGTLLLTEVFNDLSVRPMGDVDLLVDRADLETARAVLARLGYVEGKATNGGRVVVETSRQMRLYEGLHGNRTVFRRSCGEPVLSNYELELSHNLFLPGHRVSVSAAQLRPFMESHSINGVPALRLTPPAVILDLCADVFLKSTTLFWIEEGAPSLMKIAGLGAASLKWGAEAKAGLRRMAVELGVVEAIAFSLHLSAEILGRDRVGELVDEFPLEREELFKYGQVDGVVGHWDRPPRERIFDIPDSAAVPGSAYLATIRGERMESWVEPGDGA